MPPSQPSTNLSSSWEAYSSTNQIDALMKKFGYKKWGFVIYRCTYGNDESWAQFMAHINKRTLDGVAGENRMDMASSLDWSVQEDSTLQGASKVEIRRRSRDWVAVEGRKEHSPERRKSELHSHPRFNFCIHVEADSLDAVIRRGSQPGDDLGRDARSRLNEGYVNIIRADCEWTWDEYDPVTFDREAEGYEVDEDPLDENEVEVEGCKLYDVGWMKTSLDGLVPHVYAELIAPHVWVSFQW